MGLIRNNSNNMLVMMCSNVSSFVYNFIRFHCFRLQIYNAFFN